MAGGRDSVPTFRVKLGADDLNCIDVPLSPTHLLLTYTVMFISTFSHVRLSLDNKRLLTYLLTHVRTQ